MKGNLNFSCKKPRAIQFFEAQNHCTTSRGCASVIKTFFSTTKPLREMKLLLLVVALCVLGIDGAKEKVIRVKDKDMMRKMIIYDKVKRHQ